MYQIYGTFQVNKRRSEYIEILSRLYPEDKNNFPHYRHDRLRAIYINTMNKRFNNEQGIKAG